MDTSNIQTWSFADLHYALKYAGKQWKEYFDDNDNESCDFYADVEEVLTQEMERRLKDILSTKHD